MVLNPRESAKLIASKALMVKINEYGIEKLGDILVEEIESGKLSPSNFSQTDVHPKSTDKNAIDWIFVVDTLNFCFWHYKWEEGWVVNGLTGYFALCGAINRAVKQGIDILNPKFYSTITKEKLAEILKSDNKVEIPLFDERLKCLHEVGNVLLEKFDGSFENVVKKANHSAKTLLNLVVENFQCFKDEADYNGQRVSLYKRAQILVGDIWACFENKDLGYFEDIEEITAFADYRVPQTLLWYGALEYQEDLQAYLDDNVIFKNGDDEEIEIRGCTIHAVELLKEYVAKKLSTNKTINSILIDHFLWDFRRKHAKEIEEKGLPFHKTFSIYY
ncbi:queuosine salvage protein [Diabrotica virgifera virgifera]|uniref:Queuosine 5'-phosphate N-glycosylase/hydrolase n=1 Tax=Diabrotica virgifera virgifera TaxID=50390 RepID=A0A6P7GPM4_DIAVI|nr:queuosine salvage protein [Diabrotica virgifera virgifera]